MPQSILQSCLNNKCRSTIPDIKKIKKIKKTEESIVTPFIDEKLIFSNNGSEIHADKANKATPKRKRNNDLKTRTIMKQLKYIKTA